MRGWLPLIALLLLAPSIAEASESSDLTYHFEQVWSASVRMIRVDLRLSVQDQDESIGYVLFEWKDSTGRQHPGGLELVRTREDDRDYVRVVVQIPAMPSYVEQMVLDRLERKLRAEFGDPPESRRRRREDPPPEDPEDGAEDDPGEAEEGDDAAS